MRPFMTSRVVFAGLLLVFVQAAHAQSPEEMASCVDQAGSVSKMLECGIIEIGKWDARLNVAYQTLLRRETDPKRAKLQAEQKAWLQHHLSETRRLASDPNTGLGAFMLSQDFEIDDTSKRTLELEKRVRDES